MDRKLQERLVGACVLVVVGVLVIPEFLTGPRQQVSITQGLELPAEGESELQTVTIRMDRTTDKPQSPVASVHTETRDTDSSTTAAQVPPPGGQSTVSKPVAQTGTKAVATQAREPTRQAVAAAGTDTGWAVQVGSFSQEENARRLANTLKQQGYATAVSEHRTRGRALHRVRVGPLKTRAEADMMAARLSREGQQAAVVPLP